MRGLLFHFNQELIYICCVGYMEEAKRKCICVL
jgi:hypothetical protein